MEILLHILIVLLTGIAIYYLGNIFAKSSSNIGDYLNLPRSIKGATFDSVASSLPEIMVALISVIFFQKFEVGIGTIAGSAIFNLLIIPGICVIIAPVIFKVSKDVIYRDALFYIISIFALLIVLLYYETWGIIIALILISIYLVYVKEMARHKKKHGKREKKKKEKFEIKKEITKFFTTMALIGVAAYFLTHSSIEFAKILGVPPVIIAITITAAATSVPDTVISAINARKGSLSDATSNVFGSNIFDITIGIGFPLLLYTVFVKPVEIAFENTEIILGLMGATIIVFYFMAEEEKLSKYQGAFMILAYLAFLAYIITLAI